VSAAEVIRLGSGAALRGPTIEEVRAWPATVDPATAATALGISRSYAYELIKRDEFPVKVLMVGSKARVPTASILRVLQAGEVDAP
jgi:predicted DNA-binding transcriptional regulator AlpA